MTNLHDLDGQHVIFNGIDDSIIPLADTVCLHSHYFLTSTWPRLLCETFYSCDNQSALFSVCNGIDFLCRRSFNSDFIARHALSGL